MANAIKNVLAEFSQDIGDFYLKDNHVHVFDTEISTKQFKLDYVAQNFPVLIKNGIQNWPAVKKWNMNYFRHILGNKGVNVAITPNGYADGLAFKNNKEYFVMPYETQMPFSEFLNHLDNPRDNFICYIQTQNSNLLKDFPELKNDVDLELSWATSAFEGRLDAVNFWMGDHRAITSMHKDPYENIYCVVEGKKDFILIPPTDIWRIPYKNYPKGIYNINSQNQFTIDDVAITEDSLDNSISWIAIDPLNPDINLYPDYKDANIFKVTVEAGDCLYLPSFWFHHVRQSHGCIAVNYWFDMQFGLNYCVFKLLEN
ncbi:bifunctional peptidase and (3S)-lysyl hydroxylase Jmjd7-like, partial [Chrysoperla carnea]|uniref:bifunctional peptidase and (3S)-lysyl hydroxylase Jmjd7-like n=1 Tax=Chrysoperla carnea TaxID=189513 RepID=UPI001D074ADA